MSAPMIWIVVPGLAGVGLFLLRKSRGVVIGVGILMSLWLALMAAVVTIEQAVTVGGLSFKVSETMFVLGREFTLTEVQRPFLIAMYLIHALWIFGAYFSQPSEAFVPFSFGMVAVLIAALSVKPFLYAALFIELIVLLAVPLLAPPDQQPGRGVYRFLAFQSFGLPFILFTGWMLAGLEASPGDLDLVVRAGALLGIGFAFMVAVFPFHSWMPMLAEDAHPYIAAFIFFMLPGTVSLFGLGFLERFVWLRESEQVFELLRAIGMVMALVGGVWAAFETHLGRMMGHAAVAETGLMLMAIGLGTDLGLVIYFWLVLPRTLAFLLWSGALSVLWEISNGDLRLDAFTGFGQRHFQLAVLLLIAQFSLAGLPVLAGFPVRLALWQQLGSSYPLIATGAIMSAIGVLAGGLRTMGRLFAEGGDKEAGQTETRTTKPAELRVVEPDRLLVWGLFGLAGGSTVIAGLFPGIFLPWLERLAAMFAQLGG